MFVYQNKDRDICVTFLSNKPVEEPEYKISIDPVAGTITLNGKAMTEATTEETESEDTGESVSVDSTEDETPEETDEDLDGTEEE